MAKSLTKGPDLSANFEVEGAKLLRRKLRAAGVDMGDLTALHRRLANIAVAKAQLFAPVRTGKFKKSIRAQASTTSAGVKYGSKAVWYAQIVEYGVRKQGTYDSAGTIIHPVIVETQPLAIAHYQQHAAAIAKKYDI